MTNPLSIALSGLNAASKRANASANNIANAGTSGATANGEGPQPYTPVDVVQTSVNTQDGAPQGVKSTYAPRENGTTTVYDPDAQYADESGLIAIPDVDLATEIVNLKNAANAYKANAAVIRVASEMEREMLQSFDETA